MMMNDKIVKTEQVRTILKQNNFNCNKTFDKKFDVEKKYKVISDSFKVMIGKVGTLVYAENYGTVSNEGKVTHTIKILLEFDITDMEEIIKERGTLGGSIALEPCIHCNQRITKCLENCRWYYKEALEEVKI